MKLQQLTIEEFTNFQKNHPLTNFYQTINYAMFASENGYDYELVGLINNNGEIEAASLILIKPIGIKCFYGYAPRGFLIDYQNKELLRIFTKELQSYFYKKNVIFIKINPCLIIGKYINKEFVYNNNYELISYLENIGYKKLANNMYFEASLPRINAFINLKSYNNQYLNKNTKNKIKKGIRKGLVFEHVTKDKLNYFIDLVKKNEFYFKDYYTVFDKEDAIDLFLVSINYDAFLQNSQYVYDKEFERNNKLNTKLAKYNNEKNINAKMASDKILLSYKNDIMEASKGLSDNKVDIIAGALVIRHNNIANIVYSIYNKNFKRFVPNYFLYYNLIKYYQKDYDYLDLNGMVADFTNNNSYTGLNKFKMGFNPDIYEYIGEFDLIIEPKSYNILLKNGILAKEFNKNN